jgi:hypothetical protein
LFRGDLVDDFNQQRRIIGFKFQHVELEEVGVLAGAAALGINERDGTAQDEGKASSSSFAKGQYGEDEKDHQARNAARREAEARARKGNPGVGNYPPSRGRLTSVGGQGKDEG